MQGHPHAHQQPDDIQEMIYAMRVSVMSVIFTDIDIDLRDPCRFSASSLRSRDRVAPVMRASSDSLGRAINAVLPTTGVRPFLPAIRYGLVTSVRLPGLARRLGILNEAGMCVCRVAI